MKKEFITVQKKKRESITATIDDADQLIKKSGLTKHLIAEALKRTHFVIVKSKDKMVLRELHKLKVENW